MFLHKQLFLLTPMHNIIHAVSPPTDQSGFADVLKIGELFDALWCSDP